MKKAVLLVGHGGAPTDFPKEKLQRLKALEGQRLARKESKPAGEEAELDALVRGWPRTQKTDPYKYGLETLRDALAARLRGENVICAYNEFCGPSMEEALEHLAAQGFEDIRVVTTMFTRGGIHSECEIPHAVGVFSKKFPNLRIRYLWPFDLSLAADFLARHLEAAP